MPKSDTRWPYVAVVLNAVILGLSFLFVKLTFAYAHPLDVLAHRFAVSFLVMSVPVALGWIKLSYRGKPWPKLLLLALLFPTSFFILQAFGLLHATSAEGGILYAFTPIVTMIMASLFLGERTSVLQRLSIVLSVVGVVFIFVMKGGRIDLSNMTGITLLLLTCVAFAGYTVFARSLLKAFRPTEVTYLALGFGAVVFVAIALTRHLSAGTLVDFFTPLAHGAYVGTILYLGVLSSLVTSLLATYVLSKMEASRMSAFANLSTLVSIAAGALFLGEAVTVYHLIGSLLIIAGVIGANRLGAAKRARPMRQARVRAADRQA